MRSVRLTDIAYVVTGATPRADEVDSWGAYMDFVTPSDQRDGVREAIPMRRLSEVGVERLQTRVVPEGATLLTCIGSTIGKVTQARGPAVTNQQINSIIARPEQVSPAFLYYMVLGWSGGLKRLASGSATPIVNKAQLERTSFQIPSLRKQQAIAEVLGALDDKIAANGTLVATSAHLLDSLFRKTRLGVLGSKTFGEIAEVGGGGTPSTRNPSFWGGGVLWAVPSDITALDAPYLEATSRTLTEVGLAASSSPLYPAGSILMTSRATIGAFAVAQTPVAVNQGFIVVRPYCDQLKWWLFHEMKRLVPEFVNEANGATFLELPRNHFQKLAVRLPDRSVIAEFDASATEIHQRCIAATRESRTLAKLRDTLLLPLMDGTLRVKDAVAQVEEVL
ncbi:restriction endonuclease subunit S [Actinomyces ruminicola]|uniref:restriction endonuclease subunit S n=1 Tax=Actinomyces ruminicola TaxID=332524 RepID=UPI0011C9AA10|nr:restriction endonuclease subunit S [Actinomyces ruminicola]